MGELVFRFPRRSMGVELLQTERDTLVHLAPIVGLPIPTPLKYGEPSKRFPYLFLGQRYVPGLPLEDLPPHTANQEALATTLGRFLRRLHDVPLSTAKRWGVPTDTFRGEMERMATLAKKIANGVKEMASEPLLSAVLKALTVVPVDGEMEEVTLCQGDLHVRHLMFDDTGLLCGIIDWGDLCIGDSAMDLIVVYSMLESSHRDSFWREYGLVSDALLARARHLALAKHLALLSSSVELGEHHVARVAREALKRVLNE